MGDTSVALPPIPNQGCLVEDSTEPHVTQQRPDLISSYSSCISYDGSEAAMNGDEAVDQSEEDVYQTLSVYLEDLASFCASFQTMEDEQREDFFFARELAIKLNYIRSKTFSSFLSTDERLVTVVDLIVNSKLPQFFLIYIDNLDLDEEVIKKSCCRKVTNYIKCQTILWNITDKSTELCSNFLQDGLPARFFPRLERISKNKESLETTNVRLFTKGMVGILFNLVQKIPSARGRFRLERGVRILLSLTDQTHVAVKTGCLLLVSDIVDETENDYINASDDNIRYVLNIFRECVNSSTRHSKEYGYHGLEMLQGLKAIASQDRNKEKLTRNNLLVLLEEFVTKHSDNWTHDEEMGVYELLWSLAYDDICRDAIRNQPKLMETMTAAAENGRSVLIRRSAGGALWKVHDIFGQRHRRTSHMTQGGLPSPAPPRDGDAEIPEFEDGLGEPESVLQAEEDKQDEEEDNVFVAVAQPAAVEIKREHVFISYSHTTQPIMLRVRDALREEGYNVWMDVDYMVGSTIEAMATAVEGAAIVVFGMCQRFKDSPHCRAELEYSYRLQKPMLPLLMEADFRADGWLGFLVGNKLTYDMYEEEHLEKNIMKVFKELGGRGKASCADRHLAAPETETTALYSCPASCCKDSSLGQTHNMRKKPVLSLRRGLGVKEAQKSLSRRIWYKKDSTDFSTMSTGSIWQRQEALTHTTAPDRDPAPVPPYLGRWAAGFGCVGCGRLRRGTSAPCGDSPRFSAWDSAQVAAWLSGLGLKDAAQRLLAAGMDGELLLEWQRMRCAAPESFYQLTRQDLQLSLVDLLRLTRGLTRLCDDARAPLIE